MSLEDELRRELVALRQQVNDLSHRVVSIPRSVSADPDADSGIHLWMMTDGRLRGRKLDGTVVEYELATAGGSTSTPPTPPYVPTSRRYLETADWSQSYNKGGAAQRSGTNDLYYGQVDNYNLSQMSMIHFPGLSVLAAGPVGTRISGVWLRLSNKHTYLNSGADLKIGLHDSASKPSSYTHSSWPTYTIRVGKPSPDKWYKLPAAVGAAMQAGIASGVVLRQSSTSRSYYGYAAGVGSSGGSAPALRIDYVK